MNYAHDITKATRFGWAVGILVLIVLMMTIIAIATRGDENGPLASPSQLRVEQVVEIEEEDLFLVYDDGKPLARP